MFKTLKNAWKTPELQKKLLFTLFIVLLYRLGACIVVPYVSGSIVNSFQAVYGSSVLGLMSILSGGAMQYATLFALSVSPYITASIVIQLLTVAIPALERMAKEGAEGQKKINGILADFDEEEDTMYIEVEGGEITIKRAEAAKVLFEVLKNEIIASADQSCSVEGSSYYNTIYPNNVTITDSVGALSKLVATVSIGVAHNGIIRITPRKGISDTMEYIITQLAPLKRAMPRFYENKNAMLMVKNAIDSKMAFLTQDGRIFTIGDFVTDNGVLYSNRTYRENTYRSLYWGC